MRVVRICFGAVSLDYNPQISLGSCYRAAISLPKIRASGLFLTADDADPTGLSEQTDRHRLQPAIRISYQWRFTEHTKHF